MKKKYVSIFAVLLIFTNIGSIFFSYEIGAKNQWVLDSPGRILLFEKLIHEPSAKIRELYLANQISYLKCDLKNIKLNSFLAENHPVHVDLYEIYKGNVDAIDLKCEE